MKKLALLSAPFLLLALIAVPDARAESPSVMLEQRLKASYNDMVQEVRKTEDPATKREIITGFLTRLDRGLGLVEKMTPASGQAHIQAADMRGTLREHLAELSRMDMRMPAAGGNLNHFAAYLQQDVERADGIYLSVGALIIVLLLLILLL